MNPLRKARTKAWFAGGQFVAVFLMVVMLVVGGAGTARAEKLKVTKDSYGCTAAGVVSSSTGSSSISVGPWASFTVDVTSAANIVAISLDWGEGIQGTMCLVWCQLFVNGAKYTNGVMVVRGGTRGPFYSFTTINSGDKKGTQELQCVYDPYGVHIPVKPGEYPLP